MPESSNQPKVTTDTIISYLQDCVEQKIQLAPSTWLDAAQKLNVLLGDEQDLLFDLQQKVAQLKIDYLQDDEKRNVSRAKMYVEATEDYRKAKQQAAKIERIEEFIRIAKIQARMKDNEYRNQ